MGGECCWGHGEWTCPGFTIATCFPSPQGPCALSCRVPCCPGSATSTETTELCYPHSLCELFTLLTSFHSHSWGMWPVACRVWNLKASEIYLPSLILNHSSAQLFLPQPGGSGLLRLLSFLHSGIPHPYLLLRAWELGKKGS